MRAWPTKDPDANLDYYFDASQFVADEGSAIASYAVAIDVAPDAALVLGTISQNGNVIQVWLSGGTLDVEYVVRCRFTLMNGAIDDLSRSLMIA